MPYFQDLHTYLHQSSLLIQAYPTTRITTKYSLPRKPNPKSKSKSQTQPQPQPTEITTTTNTTTQPKREPSATLTLKTYHPESGICLKYRTDKAAEVGRLVGGLGRLAKGEIIELPTTTSTTTTAQGGDKMDVDGNANDVAAATEGVSAVKVEDSVVSSTPVAGQTNTSGGSGGGGGKKKKKGKK